mgnify:CR=1 FL=1
MRWVIGILVVLAVAAAAWFLRDPIIGLFSSAVPAAVPEAPAVTEPATTTYASSTLGYSFDYPKTYALNEAYQYDFSPSKSIRGVAVAAPAQTGTNLGSDTRVSVEQLPRAATCTADIFIIADVKAKPVSDSQNGTEYSYATTTGAAAGNVYEEMVYAFPKSKPCTAIRYAIHSTNIGKADASVGSPTNSVGATESTVREFDRSALLEGFHAIRRSFKFFSAPETQ